MNDVEAHEYRSVVVYTIGMYVCRHMCKLYFPTVNTWLQNVTSLRAVCLVKVSIIMIYNKKYL